MEVLRSGTGQCRCEANTVHCNSLESDRCGARSISHHGHTHPLLHDGSVGCSCPATAAYPLIGEHSAVASSIDQQVAAASSSIDCASICTSSIDQLHRVLSCHVQGANTHTLVVPRTGCMHAHIRPHSRCHVQGANTHTLVVPRTGCMHAHTHPHSRVADDCTLYLAATYRVQTRTYSSSQ